MFKKETIPFSNTGTLNPLVTSYLSQSENVRAYYNYFPDKNGFKQLLETNPYDSFDRETLVHLLHEQTKTVTNTSENSLNSIQLLKNKNTFTLTTGHQLCLFTGPLYFIYKIITTIKLAEKLNQQFPKCDFVPVYWMASEDHDFEEVNHFYSGGKKIQWNSQQTGAVGKFETAELRALQTQLREIFGHSVNADFLNSLFEKSYLKHQDLATATRYLVNELFGDKGLVIIDGDDAGFKKQFKKQFSEDLFENKANNLVNETIVHLKAAGFSSQVNPRPINCFYIEKGIRSRIEKEGELFRVLGTEIRFTEKELKTLIDEHPEKLSPNVVLRPLYQQVILPNLAYIGGPGELAYWLEFNKFFQSSTVVFPILMPRNFVLFVDKPTHKKISKLKLKTSELFLSEQNLIKQIQIENNAYFQVEQEVISINKIFEQLKEKVKSIDESLLGSASAEEKRVLNGLARLSTKANRALKRRYETEIRQIQEIRIKLFPTGIPQERYENFSNFYLSHGQAFFELLYSELDPFTMEQFVFTESLNS